MEGSWNSLLFKSIDFQEVSGTKSQLISLLGLGISWNGRVIIMWTVRSPSIKRYDCTRQGGPGSALLKSLAQVAVGLHTPHWTLILSLLIPNSVPNSVASVSLSYIPLPPPDFRTSLAPSSWKLPEWSHESHHGDRTPLQDQVLSPGLDAQGCLSVVLTCFSPDTFTSFLAAPMR